MFRIPGTQPFADEEAGGDLYFHPTTKMVLTQAQKEKNRGAFTASPRRQTAEYRLGKSVGDPPFKWVVHVCALYLFLSTPTRIEHRSVGSLSRETDGKPPRTVLFGHI